MSNISNEIKRLKRDAAEAKKRMAEKAKRLEDENRRASPVTDLEAELAAVRRALNAYADSDLASLASVMMSQRRLLAESINTNDDPSVMVRRLARSILDDAPAPAGDALAGEALGAKLIAWAADEDNVYPIALGDEDTCCIFCDGYGEHDDDCLHVAARKLQERPDA